PQKLDVEVLVDDAEITESRPRETFDLEVRNCGVLRTCEMRAVDTAREQVQVAVALAARLVEARTAAEHDVRDAQQCALPLHELPRCAADGRQIVDAAV